MNSLLDILEANEPTISAIVGLLTISAAVWGFVQLALYPFLTARMTRAAAPGELEATGGRFQLWSSLVNRGVDPRSDFTEQIAGRTLNACIIALVATTLLLLALALFENDVAMSVANLFMFLMGIVAYNLHGLGHAPAARWVLVMAVMLYWNTNLLLMGTRVGLEYALGGILLLPLLLFDRREQRQVWIASAIIVISLPLSILAESRVADSWPFNTVGLPPFYYHGNAIVLGVLVFLALSFYNRSADASFRELEDQDRKAEELIHSLLPAYIAEKVKTRGTTVADWHSEASVLFATVVGFERLYKRVSAVQLVELLRHVFEEFDELVKRHGVEKINTLGTNYVAATGIDASLEASCAQLAQVALGMREVVAQVRDAVDHPFALRIGICTGDVVSGVIGDDRPSFDIWGRTVELANTIREDVDSNSIVVNEATFWRLKSAFVFERHPLKEQSFILLGSK